MPKTFPTAALAALLTLAVVPPADAAAEWHHYGPACEVAASSTGDAAVVTAGPKVVTDAQNQPASTVVVFCLIQDGSDVPWENVVASKYSAPMPGVGFLPAVTVPLLNPATKLFECTGIWSKLPDGTWVHGFEDNLPFTTGVQCAPIKIFLP